MFGDYALADDLRQVEARYRNGWDFDTAAELTNAIRSCYDLTEEESASPAASHRNRPLPAKNERLTTSVAAT